MPVGVTVDHIQKQFAGGFRALRGATLEIKPGELLALLGPSGSGKTTLLRLIAGLEVADDGIIRFDDVDAQSLTLRERGIGFVFQHYALFRHMSVFENVAFGLRSRPRSTRPSSDAIKTRVNDLLDLMQLPDIGHRFPAQLSGGQRQRVALARALAIEPRVLLLDEPFGALDAKVRHDLRKWLRHIHDKTGYTTIFVTHDQDEALEIADRVAIFRAGQVEQIGTPRDLLDHPVNDFVAEFLAETKQRSDHSNFAS